MSKLMEALFPGGRPSFVAAGAEGEVAACLSALAADPRISELLAAQESGGFEPAPAPGEGMSDDGFWPPAGHWMCAYRPYVVRDGILQIPIKGVLLADLSFSIGTFATGYAYIGRAIERGIADGNVRGIALVMHTPGGEVRKCFDLAERIEAAGKLKPVVAYAEDFAYSAGYLLAAPARKVLVSKTGGVGSIGVVTSHVDASASLQMQGLKITFIHAGKHKVDGNSASPLPDDVKARIQARIDELMTAFVLAVAKYRRLDEATVRGFEAATFTASQGVENGLADAVGTISDAVAACAALINTASEEHESMTISQEQHDAALATARSEGEAAGARAANDRVSAVLASPAVKGRELAAVSLALASPTMAPEAVSAFVGSFAPAAAAAPAPVQAPAAAPLGRLDALVPDPAVSADAQAAGSAASDPLADAVAGFLPPKR